MSVCSFPASATIISGVMPMLHGRYPGSGVCLT